MKKSPRQIGREAASLMRHLRSHPYGRLMICKVKGGLWWTDGYVAARVDQAVERLLADYNLKPEPMVCAVGRTIVRNDNTAPDIAKLLEKYTPKRGMVEVRPLEFGGHTLTIKADRGDAVVELWSTDGATVTHRLNSAYVARVMAAGGDRFKVLPGTSNAVVRFDGAEPVGMVMPVRSDPASLGVDLTNVQEVAA